MKSLLPILFLCLLAGLTSCAEEGVLAPEPLDLTSAFLIDEGENGIVDLPDLGLEEPITNHVAGHSAAYREAEMITETRPDGSTETLYLVDGDIALTKDQLRELQEMEDNFEKQYRTNNLVSDNYITVIGYTGSGYALSSKMRTALQWAVNNYNALNTNKQFALTFGVSTDADIVVYQNNSESGAGGQAGFPSGGRPFKFVQIYSGMNNYDTNTNEHVITHEIGHAMGLRHTDWFSRQSCRQSGEPSNPDGAVHIPGTPTGYDANSVMLSCFGGSEDGEFGYYDRVALEYLY